MFNIGPLEMVVLAAVALIVFGPEKLPELAKDAARMLRTLRDLAQGARTQLNDELGPDFADFDLSSLNPRTAIKNALLGDEELSSFNPGQFNARDAFKKLVSDDSPSMTKTDPVAGSSTGGPSLTKPSVQQPASQQPAPPVQLPAAERTPWDSDAT